RRRTRNRTSRRTNRRTSNRRRLKYLLRNLMNQSGNHSTVTHGQPAAQPIAFEQPTVADGAEMWRLVRESGVLDENSCYAYLLLCRHFDSTCLVARQAGDVVGFVAAYRPPNR